MQQRVVGTFVRRRALPLALLTCLAACEGAVDSATVDGGMDAVNMGEEAGSEAGNAQLDASVPGDAAQASDAADPLDAEPETPSDASVADAARDAAVSDAASAQPGCAGKAYKLCEDFEGASNGALPANWSAADGWTAGKALVADDQAHSGSKSLKSPMLVNGQPRAARSLSALGATANHHWGRVFYRVDPSIPLPPSLDMPPQSVIHATLVGIRGSSESRVVDTVVNQQGKHQFLYNLPDDSCCVGSSYDYASFDGKWHCAEWYVDAASQSFRFFFEGKEVTSLAFSYGADDKARIGDYQNIVLGVINYQKPKTPYFQAWFDDLAIDDQRVGCQ